MPPNGMVRECLIFLCSIGNVAQDVRETLALQLMGTLPAHPLEDYLVPPPLWQNDKRSDKHLHDFFIHLLEVCINDFIQLAQSTDPAQLLHHSCALLHGIYLVFPPPSVTGGTKEDPVALKKLHQGDGLWETQKELPGCLSVQWYQMLH